MDESIVITRAEAWSAIIAVNQKMLVMAHEFEWTEMLELEAYRKKLIDNYLRLYDNEISSPELIKNIKQLIDMNANLLTLAHNSKHGVKEKLQAIRKGQDALSAYHKTVGK